MEIPKRAVICAAQHFVAAHESACTGTPVDWGSICSMCGEFEACKGDWTETAAPVFDAAGIHPQVLKP